MSQLALDELDREWVFPTVLGERIGVGHGHDWVRVALVLERLAADRLIELRTGPKGRVRRFRRREWRV